MSSASTTSINKSVEQRSKSCETVCTSNSSCLLQKRKPLNPLSLTVRPVLRSSGGSNVRQRVLSAKLIKLRSIQSKLNDAHFHLAELAKENHVLKTLQKRQDKALSKYENTNADLPRLIHSHEEEIRTLNEKNRTLRRNLKEVSDTLKTKEEELTSTREQLKRLEKLSKDKHLSEREKLTEQVEDLKMQLEKSDAQVTMLNRKLILENKSAKHKLHAEWMRNKQMQRELSFAAIEIERLGQLLHQQDQSETRSKLPKRILAKMPQRQSVSMVTLSDSKTNNNGVSDVKLQPLCVKANGEKRNGILKFPSDRIKSRLSNSNSAGSSSTNSNETETLDHVNDKMVRSNSGVKLAKISQTLEEAVKKVADVRDFDSRLGEFCTEIVDNVQNSSDLISSHQANLEQSRAETDTIIEALQETEAMEKQLKSTLYGNDVKNSDFINDILKEEFQFQMSLDERIQKVKEPMVKMEEKKKLLATLRAIDNGESFEMDDKAKQLLVL